MSLHLSWAGLATRPGGAAGPALAPCAGPPLRPRSPGAEMLVISDKPGGVR